MARTAVYLAPLASLLTFISGGCIINTMSGAELRSSLVQRAGFDMSCAKDQLQLTELSKSRDGHPNSYGVTGCGKKHVYVRNDNSTTWVLNSRGN